jgi:hypothetical protein
MCKEEYKEVCDKVAEAIKCTSIFQSAQNKPQFKINRNIALDGTSERVFFQFGPSKGKSPQMRIEFNPAKLGSKGIFELNKVLLEIVPDAWAMADPWWGGWTYVYKNGRPSRIDITVDIPNICMGDFHLLEPKGLTYREYRRDGHIQTIYIGKRKGNHIKVYSPSEKLKLKGHAVTQSVVRIEQTLRNLNMKLAELEHLKNPVLTVPYIRGGMRARLFYPPLSSDRSTLAHIC